MGFLVFLVVVFVFGLAAGALARLAVPGPDPMPIWATAALGIGGSVVGGIVARLLIGSYGGLLFAFLGAVLLLILYRHFVQHRPLARAPRGSDQVMVEGDDLERALRRLGQQPGGTPELAFAQTTRLVPPGTDRVEPDDVEPR